MELNENILKSLGIKKEEWSKFIYLFLYSFSLGLFIAFYFAPANAEFIRHFRSTDLPLAYIVAGIAGYIMTAIYSSLQKKIHSKYLFITALTFMFIIPLLSRGALSMGFNEKWLSFFVFIWGWPFISMAAIETGGLAIKFLNLQQVKRLYGLINSGGVIASIIGYMTIPLISPFISHAYDLLVIGVIGIIASIYIIYIIYKKFWEEDKEENASANEEQQYRFKDLVKEKYFLLIFMSATLSMVVIYFSDFGFLAGIKSQDKLLNSPLAVANFIAIVFGVLKIGELIISIFSSRLLSRWGISMGLSILPIVSGVLILGASVSAILLGVNSYIFLGFVVMNKSLERILRRGLDDPSFNILYQPLKNDQKLMLQTRVGVIMQLAIGIAGILLFAATKVFIKLDGTFDLTYFNLMFLPFLVVWFFVTRKLYGGYKLKLREILEEKNKENKYTKATDIYGSDLLLKQFESDIIENTSLSITILAETNPDILEPYTQNLLNYNDTTIRKSLLRCISPIWNTDIYNTITNLTAQEQDDEEEMLLKKAKLNLDYTNVEKLSEHKLLQYSKANDFEKNLLVVKNIQKFKLYRNIELIKNLFDCEDKSIKQAAIYFAKENGDISLIRILVNLLKSPEYRHLAANKLIECSTGIEEMERMLSETDNINISLKIIEIYARIGSDLTNKYLLNRINHPSMIIQEAVINALYFAKFQANDQQAAIVKERINDVVGHILWLFVCISEIERQKNVLKLVQALDIEHTKKFDVLFNLLSFINKPATIELIKTNIIGENTIYALEIIDNFIAQDTKKVIIPVFDKISVSQRVKKLKFIREVEKLSFEQRLKEIINAKDTEVDLWTKTKALELLGKVLKKISPTITQEESVIRTINDVNNIDYQLDILDKIAKANIPADIFHSLHHKDELIYSTAAGIIYNENPALCIEYLNTLSDDKKELINILTTDSADLLNEKVKYIRRVPDFFGFPENTLVKLARLFKTVNANKGDEIDFEIKGEQDIILIVVKGKLSYKLDNTDKEISFKRNDTIVKGFNIPSTIKKIYARGDTMYLSSNRFAYFNLLVYETEIIDNLFVKKRFSRIRTKI